MRNLIIYYALTENTDAAARTIAGRLGAELLRLEPERAYPDSGFRKFFWGGKSAVMAERPALKPYRFEPDAFDRVILGFPVWAGTFAPPLRTFALAHGEALRGLRLAAFACQSGAGGEKALAKLRQCLGVDALEAELVLIDPKDKPAPENDAKLEAFCARLRASERSMP